MTLRQMQPLVDLVTERRGEEIKQMAVAVRAASINEPKDFKEFLDKEPSDD